MRLFTERRSAIWLSFAFASMLAAAPVFAQGTPQAVDSKAPPPPASQKTPPKVQPPPVVMDLNGKDAQRTIPGAYRLTYTLTEMDGTNRVGSQRYQVVLDADAPPTNMSSGTRIPIETAATAADNSISPRQTQISYVDVGVDIRARLRQFANGMELNSRIVQSTVESKQTSLMTPVIRQTSIDNTVLLIEGKTVVIGSADIPGSTHSLQVQVELTRVR